MIRARKSGGKMVGLEDGLMLPRSRFLENLNKESAMNWSEAADAKALRTQHASSGGKENQHALRTH